MRAGCLGIFGQCPWRGDLFGFSRIHIHITHLNYQNTNPLLFICQLYSVISASWKIALIFDNDDDDLMIKMHWYMTKICGNLCHISKRRELVPYFGKSLAQVVIRGSHRSWVAYESWHDKCQKIYFWEPSFIYKNLYSDRNSGRVVEKMFNGWGAVRFSGIFQSVGSRRDGRWILTLPPWGASKSVKLLVSRDGWENIWCWG